MLFCMTLVFIQALFAQEKKLKIVSSANEYCFILNQLEKLDLENEADEIKTLGYESDSFIDFGFNHPEVLIPGYCQGKPVVELKDPGTLELKCEFLGLKNETDYSFSYNPWVSLFVSDLKFLNKTEGTCSVTFINNKSLFMELTSLGGNNYSNSAEIGLILYPKESYKYPKPLKFHIFCDKDYYVRFEFNFSRGEFTGISREEFLLCSGITAGSIFYLYPDCMKKMSNIGFSNNALIFSVLDLYWTAMFGDWLKRDMVENGINAIFGFMDLCPECDEVVAAYFGGRKIVPDLYKLSREVSPQNLISFFIKISVILLQTPSTKDAVFSILSKYLPSTLTAGGAAVLAQNLSVILIGGTRVLALAPMVYDSWDTQRVEDISAFKIFPLIKFTFKNK